MLFACTECTLKITKNLCLVASAKLQNNGKSETLFPLLETPIQQQYMDQFPLQEIQKQVKRLLHPSAKPVTKKSVGKFMALILQRALSPSRVSCDHKTPNPHLLPGVGKRRLEHMSDI